MTPQERELIMKVVQRVQQAPAQTKDPDAEHLIREQMAQQPDSLYLLTQAVIIQEHGLQQAQQRIGSLEADLQQARASSAGSTSGGFLGGMLGGTAGNAVPASPGNNDNPRGAQPGASPTGASRPTGSKPRPTATNSQAPAGGANRGGGMGDFMRNAAMMAVGVAGGHMLYNGLQGMFGDDQEATPPDGETAAADTPDSAADGAEPVAADSGGWGADQGVSDEALSGDDPSLWEQPDPGADGWGDGDGSDVATEDFSPEQDTGFDSGDIGGDDDWG